MKEYQKSHLEDAIEQIYMRIGITSPRQLDMLVVTKRLGIDLLCINGENHHFHHTISLNKDLSIPEMWEGYGHELGHIIRTSGNQLFLPYDFVRMQESQADNFALLFCVPTFMLLEIDLPYDINKAVSLIERTFNVTTEFAVKRLKYHENKLLAAEENRIFQEKCTQYNKAYELWYR